MTNVKNILDDLDPRMSMHWTMFQDVCTRIWDACIDYMYSAKRYSGRDASEELKKRNGKQGARGGNAKKRGRGFTTAAVVRDNKC